MRAQEFLKELFAPGKEWKWSFTGSQEAVAVFHVGGIPYQFYAYRPSENFPGWDVEFKNAERGKDRTTKFGLTGTGNSAEVMSTVTDIMRGFLTKYQGQIKELTFTADEPSRRALYARMAKRLLPTWELQQDGKEFKLVAPGNKQQGVAEGVAEPLPGVLYHGAKTPITTFKIPPYGVYFSPHKSWAENYGDVIIAARVNAKNVYLIDYTNDIDNKIVDALFDRDYQTVAKFIKLLQSKGYDAMQTVTDSEMVVVFPGTPIQVINDQQGMLEGPLSETWGIEKYPIPLPIGNYLGPDSDEFAPPGNYRDSAELHDEVYDLIDAGVEPDIVPVDPKQLLATQDWLSNAGGDDPLFDEYPDRPVVYEKAGKYYILDGHHRTTRAWKTGRPISVYLFSDNQLAELDENFADGKVKGKSRPGRVKRAGASCNGSVTDLRQRAKNASGEKAKMYHWCANMKSGSNKNK